MFILGLCWNMLIFKCFNGIQGHLNLSNWRCFLMAKNSALKKIQGNAIKSALESNTIHLNDYWHLEDAKKEVTSIKRKSDGYTAIGLKDTVEKWVQWHIKNGDLVNSLPKLMHFQDIYISINSMLSPIRQLKNLRHLHAFWVDLDYYKIKRFKNKTADEMIALLRKKKLFDEVEPSFFIDSGNGMYIFYLIETASMGALPIWQKIQTSFIEKFAKYGADPLSADAVHVLRLAGTVNSKTGRRAKFLFNSEKEFRYEMEKESLKIYTIDELSKTMLPLLPHSKEEWVKIKEAKRQTKKIKESKKEIALFNLHTLHFARLNDIQTLQKVRNGDCGGIREVMCFLYRYYSCLFIKDPESALINVLDFNSQFTCPLEEKEVIEATKSAERAYKLWENTFAEYTMLKETPPINTFFRKAGCYIYSNKKLIELLNIEQNEMTELSTIINTKEKNRRSKDYRNEWKKDESKRKRRDDSGLTSRQKSKLNNLIEILKLRDSGLKQKEIAEKLGITQQAISKLIKEYNNKTLDPNLLNAINSSNNEKKITRVKALGDNSLFDITDLAQ